MNNAISSEYLKSTIIETRVGNSIFNDDIWDVSPYFTSNSLSKSYQRFDFTKIKAQNLKHTVKLYIVHKLSMVKPQTAGVYLRSITGHFIPYCDLKGITSFYQLTKKMIVDFCLWLREVEKVSSQTGYNSVFVVEQIIRIGQIKGWDVPKNDILSGITAAEIWESGKYKERKKYEPIPDDIFDRILSCAVKQERDVLTKSGIIIQSQTGLRINEVLSIQEDCLKEPKNSTAYIEVSLSKTVKGEPIVHKVFANNLVIEAVKELQEKTRCLREESGRKDLFLLRNNGINVPTSTNWSCHRLRTFIRKHDIRDGNGELYHLRSHQFRATFVKHLILKQIPLAYVMKQFSHVSIEMTSHYLSLQQHEVKNIYAQLILSPESKIAGLDAMNIQKVKEEAFKGVAKERIDDVISELASHISFNPLPNGVCLYDYRRGNCTNGDSCFFYNCPNFITEIKFLPVLKRELELMELEMERTRQLGYERQWQIQYSRHKYLKPLVDKLEVLNCE